MPKTKISEFSTTPGNNTDIDGINIAEGCAPSGINDAIRELMSQLKDFQTGAAGDPFNGAVNGSVGATTPSTGAFTTLTTSSTVTLNGGTSNGVAYLNGSKVLTTGSALTFDGTTLTAANTINVPNTFGFKNRIINGAMMIDQRNAGASVTPIAGQYVVDRFGLLLSQTSKLTAQQNAGSVTPPAGFSNYFGVTSTSAYSLISTDYFWLSQPVEGYNVADFAYGTANAASSTLSFWVRSSLTGAFSGSLRNSAGNRSYVFSYTINAANTWEYKTITIAGDTAGTWLTNNGIGIRLTICLGSGSTRLSTAGSWQSGDYDGATGATSVVGTNGATFYITGVQLEKGSTATPFDYRPYGTELALCQRYYQRYTGGGQGGNVWDQNAIGTLNALSGTDARGFMPCPMLMRAAPSFNSSNVYLLNGTSSFSTTIGAGPGNTGSNNVLRVAASGVSGLTAGAQYMITFNPAAAGYVEASAEL